MRIKSALVCVCVCVCDDYETWQPRDYVIWRQKYAQYEDDGAKIRFCRALVSCITAQCNIDRAQSAGHPSQQVTTDSSLRPVAFLSSEQKKRLITSVSSWNCSFNVWLFVV